MALRAFRTSVTNVSGTSTLLPNARDGTAAQAEGIKALRIGQGDVSDDSPRPSKRQRSSRYVQSNQTLPAPCWKDRIFLMLQHQTSTTAKTLKDISR